tara:strand:- start:1282 stop:1833 length:552 start_codon:yes stop_codon:yes gene_type:complete
MVFTAEHHISVPSTYLQPETRQPVTDNPMMNTSFRFLMTKVPTMTYFCQRVNLPSLTLEAIEQPTRYGTRLYTAGDAYNYEDLSVDFIVDENMKNWLEIYDWLRTCANLKDMKEFEEKEQHTTDAELLILNSAYKAIKSVSFSNLIPTSIGSLQFDSSATETEPVIASATFRFSSYEITSINS